MEGHYSGKGIELNVNKSNSKSHVGHYNIPTYDHTQGLKVSLTMYRIEVSNAFFIVSLSSLIRSSFYAIINDAEYIVQVFAFGFIDFQHGS